MQKNTPPEERLPALIKGKEKSARQERAGEEGPDNPKDKQAPAGVQARMLPYISRLFRADIFKNRIFEPAILRMVNRYLLALSAVLAVIMTADIIFIKPYKRVESLLREEAAASSGIAPKIEAAEPGSRGDYSQYSAPISGREIFGQAPPDKPVAPKIDVSGDISGELGLVGIIPGDEPQAIIEDKKSLKTYYLNKGQSFDGYTVEDILDGKVMLDREGRKTALFL